MTRMKKEVQLKKAKKKSESTRVNLLTLRSWTQDQDNTIEKRRKKKCKNTNIQYIKMLNDEI